MGDYIEYRGVPYAQPSVGQISWRTSQPPKPWNGIYEADPAVMELK